MSEPVPQWVFLIIPIVLIGGGLVIALRRKGSVAATRMGTRRMEVVSAMDPATVFARIVGIAGGYKVDDADQAAKVMILSSSPTLMTWGFLFPIAVEAAGAGSRIEIGIRSKLMQAGPMVTRAHKQCVAAIEEAIGVPAARVAASDSAKR